MIRPAISARLLPLALAFVAACATPPKPNELDAFEKLKQSPNLDAARRRAPEMTADAERLLSKSQEEWQSNDLEESRRDALMGSIKLKTALALVEQDQSKARADKASQELGRAEDELGRVNKDLQAANEQIALLQKLKETSSQAAMQQEKMKRELAEQQAAAAAKDKLAAAELALKSADTVDAQNNAKVEYLAAQDSLARAEAQFKAGDYNNAAQTADLAKDQAARALQTAKPTYEASESSKSNKARDEALSRDVSGIAGVQVRLDRRGDVQRLVVPLRGLFAKKSTVITPGSDGAIDQLAAIMKKYPTYHILVIGYTDSRGKRDELLALSQARATAVYSALVQRGVESGRMVVSGNGADEPVSDNKSVAGRAQNNRVEVVFLYQ
jgi:outer membrane protein OmpA-like peptidoglycan-associated protein